MDGGKNALRGALLRDRRGLSEEEHARAAAELARRVAELPEVAAAGTIAAYVSVGGEPGTRELLDALHRRGVRVLLPVLRADNDLDWSRYLGPDSLRRSERGLLESAAPPLGAEAVLGAEVVLLPGLAVDAAGTRLGRGGGSYDRVLARLEAAGAAPSLVVLLYAGEIVERLPAEPHDRPVHAAVTPEGVHRFRAR